MEPPLVRGRRSPNRPSFLAPTKASLARSHPDILERALSRSPTRRSTSKGNQDEQQKQTETRGFGLRDRKALRPSLTLTGSPADPLQRSQQSPLSFPRRRSSGLGAFAAPPRRVSKRISASDLQFQSLTTPQVKPPEPSVINTPEDQLASELGSATGPPGLDGDFEGPPVHDGFDEPDLPPTPTQLGLERPPGRTRRLLSSSPSTQHGKWGKRRATGELEQSPSKLRNVDYGAEAEVSTERSLIIGDTPLPEPVLKKRRLRAELSSELETLKQDVAKLEGLSERLDQHDDVEPYLNDLISLLISADPSHVDSTSSRAKDPTISSLISTLLPFSTKRPPEPRRTPPELNPFALGHNAQAESYLSALAPLKLTASSNILSTSKPDLLERHQLTLSAPRPFPPNLYKVSIYYETNPETQSLVSLSAENSPTNSRTPTYLRQWMNTRLANPLLKLDISGLCWGINRYWEALISRAHIWAHVEDIHGDLIPGFTKPIHAEPPSKNTPGPENTDSDNNTGILTTSDLRRILPHIERTSVIFESREKSLGVILSCELTIDEWTSEPQLTPSLCVSTGGTGAGSDNKVEQESKKLFQAILSESTDNRLRAAGGSDAQAIVKATDCVLSALFGGKLRTKGKV